MYPLLALTSVDCTQYIVFDFLAESSLRPQVSMWGKVQSNSGHVLVNQLIVTEFTRIQVQDVVVHLI